MTWSFSSNETPKHLLVHLQAFVRERLRDKPVGGGESRQAAHAPVEPAAVRMAFFQALVYGRGRQQLAACGIHREHLAGPEAALGRDRIGRVIIDADLGGQRDVAVARDDVARRTQAVAIHHAGGVATVAQHDAGGPVPRFHVDRVVFVKRLQVGVHVGHVLPRRRDQKTHRAKHVHAAHQQDFEHVVEAARVGTVHRDQRRQLRKVGQMRALEDMGARLRPTAVAAYRVDLAVVGEEAKRLRQAPLRPRVGREALVENTDRGRKRLVVQVPVEHRQVVRHDQALVGKGARRQAGDVERRIRRRARDLGAPAGDEQAALEIIGADGRVRADENLLDARQRRQRVASAYRGIYRHLAPTRHRKTLAAHGLFQTVPAGGGVFRIQKHHADGERLRRRKTGRARLVAHVVRRHFEQQAATVAGLAVGCDRAPMGKPAERVDRGLDQPVAGAPVHLRDQAETATVLFELRPKQPVGRCFLHDCSHRFQPASIAPQICSTDAGARAVSALYTSKGTPPRRSRSNILRFVGYLLKSIINRYNRRFFL